MATIIVTPHPFLTDYAVRRALSLAIDRQVLVDAGYGSVGQVTCNVLPAPAIYASTANDKCKTQNVTEANRILDEAGWKRGIRWCTHFNPLSNFNERSPPGHAGVHLRNVETDWC